MLNRFTSFSFAFVLAVSGFMACYPSAAEAGWTESVPHIFQGEPSDGQSPRSALLAGPGGVYYGTTQEGGSYSNTCILFYCGTVFELKKQDGKWVETII